MDRWRVEELAERADVSVDTIRFYQKRRLLAPPARRAASPGTGPSTSSAWPASASCAAEGLTLALIGRVLSGELDATDAPLAVAVADADAPEEFLTLAELAERSGGADPLLEAVARRPARAARPRRRASATPRPTSTSSAPGLALLETGFPLPDLLALAREHNDATHDIAEQAVALFDRHVRRRSARPTSPTTRRPQRLVDAFRMLLPAVTALVEHHFRRVLLAVAQEHLESVGEDDEIAAASIEAARRLESRPRMTRDATETLAVRPATRRRVSSRRCSIASRRATTSSTGC